MKKVFFGVAVVAIALSASAFTNATSKLAAGDIYAGTQPNDPTYTKITSGFNSNLCENIEEFACYYTVTQTGASQVTQGSYTRTQLEAFKAAGYVTESTTKGYYNPL